MSHGIVTATASEIERDLFYRWPATRVLCTLLLGDQDICWAPEHPLQYDYHSSVDQPRDRSVFSSEVRYASLWDGPFQLIGGIFYQKEESEFSSQVIEVDSFGVSSPLPEDSYVNYWITNETEQLAVFGELTYDFTDSLSATVGARGFNFDINEVSQNRVTRFRPVAAPLAFSSSSEDDVTWRFNLSYDMGDYLLYTTYAEGFRSGGNNEPDFTTGTVLPPYQSDSVQSYELGAKGSLFGGQLQLDVAAYYMDWQDIHARVDAEIEGSEFIILGNAGAATIQGIELGAVASKPFDNADFTFGGNLALINAELSEDDPFGRTGLDGDRIPNIPEVTFNLFADWDFSVFTGWNTSARIDYLYVGKSYSHFRPDSPIYNEQGDYSLVNLRLTFDNDRYRLGFFVDNVLDEDGVLSWISDFNFRRPDEIYPMRPRTYGIDVGYRF
jgi:outer membrane receptor protein involved in Fe transport